MEVEEKGALQMHLTNSHLDIRVHIHLKILI